MRRLAAATARRPPSALWLTERPLRSTGRWRSADALAALAALRQLSTSTLTDPRRARASSRAARDEHPSASAVEHANSTGWADAVYPNRSGPVTDSLDPECRSCEPSQANGVERGQLNGHGGGGERYRVNGHVNGEYVDDEALGILRGHWTDLPLEFWDVHGNRVLPMMTDPASEGGSWAEIKRGRYGSIGGRGYEEMTEAERIQWEQEVNELSACDRAIEELASKWCHPHDRLPGGRYPASPSPPSSGPEERPLEPWRPPTKSEYLGSRRSQRFLSERAWFERMSAAVLTEVRAVAKAGAADAQAEHEHVMQRLRDGEMSRLAMRLLVQPPPKKLATHLVYAALRKPGAHTPVGELKRALVGLSGLEETADYQKVEEALRITGGETLPELLRLESQFERRLSATVSKLAALTIYEVRAAEPQPAAAPRAAAAAPRATAAGSRSSPPQVSSTLLRAEGGRTKVSALSMEIGELVLKQYERDALQFESAASKLQWEVLQSELGDAQPAAAAAAEEEAAAAAAEPVPWEERHEIDRVQSTARRLAHRVDSCRSVKQVRARRPPLRPVPWRLVVPAPRAHYPPHPIHRRRRTSPLAAERADDHDAG